MIFNLSQGGVAYISVTAPSGASITASCQGLELTGTGTCTLEAPIIGEWHIECVYSGVRKPTDVYVDSYGVTKYVTFTYTAIISVTTSPSASVTATKTGQTTLTGTADANGICNLTVPAGGLGDWSIASSIDGYSNSGTVNVGAYDNSYPVQVALPRPSFNFAVGSNIYWFNTSTATTWNNDFYFYRDSNGINWEFYAKTSGTIQFVDPMLTDLFLCAGGAGGRSREGVLAIGGDGGARKTLSAVSFESAYIPVVVGLGGNPSGLEGRAGGHSSLGGYSSEGGAVSSGAANHSVNGSDGGYCFDDSSAKGADGNSRKVGAGGGHGAYATTDGTTPEKWQATNGGSYNAGDGGDALISGGMTPYADDGEDGGFYGAGGGGSGAYRNTNPYVDNYKIASGGKGHSGLVGMRNKR